jgi:hypothetical protein
VEARIVVDGADADVESLWDWLRREPGLRGQVRMDGAAAPAGAMGVSVELVVAMSGAGAVAAVARSLSVWLEQRRSDLSVRVTAPDGRKASVSARRVSDPERLLRSILGSGGFTQIEHADPEQATED